MQKLGWTAPSVVTYLAAMNDLDTAKKTAETELGKLRNDIAQARNTLQSVNNEITGARVERAALANSISNLRQTLNQLVLEESHKRKHLELADNLLLLLRDPSKLSVDKLSGLIADLYKALCAMMQPELHFFPLDFQPLRKKTLELWGIILGKEFILKEIVDAERKRQADQDRDKLSKMDHKKTKNEEGKAEVQQAKEELVKLAREAEQMTKETALKLVVGMEKEGLVTSYTCDSCKSTMSICLGTTACKQPITCPSCGAPLRNSRHLL